MLVNLQIEKPVANKQLGDNAGSVPIETSREVKFSPQIQVCTNSLIITASNTRDNDFTQCNMIDDISTVSVPTHLMKDQDTSCVSRTTENCLSSYHSMKQSDSKDKVTFSEISPGLRIVEDFKSVVTSPSADVTNGLHALNANIDDVDKKKFSEKTNYHKENVKATDISVSASTSNLTQLDEKSVTSDTVTTGSLHVAASSNYSTIPIFDPNRSNLEECNSIGESEASIARTHITHKKGMKVLTTLPEAVSSLCQLEWPHSDALVCSSKEHISSNQLSTIDTMIKGSMQENTKYLDASTVFEAKEQTSRLGQAKSPGSYGKFLLNHHSETCGMQHHSLLIVKNASNDQQTSGNEKVAAEVAKAVNINLDVFQVSSEKSGYSEVAGGSANTLNKISQSLGSMLNSTVKEKPLPQNSDEFLLTLSQLNAALSETMSIVIWRMLADKNTVNKLLFEGGELDNYLQNIIGTITLFSEHRDQVLLSDQLIVNILGSLTNILASSHARVRLIERIKTGFESPDFISSLSRMLYSDIRGEMYERLACLSLLCLINLSLDKEGHELLKKSTDLKESLRLIIIDSNETDISERLQLTKELNNLLFNETVLENEPVNKRRKLESSGFSGSTNEC
ncbi:uncharacterized protein [Watersipora subatra]|uniref:uncharacterized protein n=1 Tax=Watersipora subatra TaxID=2589382 RepID=UPI00355C518D